MPGQSNQQKRSEGTAVMAELISVELINISGYDDRGWMPLHAAVYENKSLLVKSLIQNGANVDARTDDGETSLCMAIYRLFPEMVEILLQHNASI